MISNREMKRVNVVGSERLYEAYLYLENDKTKYRKVGDTSYTWLLRNEY